MTVMMTAKKTAVENEQMRQLFAASNMSLLSSILLATILAYAQRDVIAPTTLLTWLAVLVTVSLARAVLVRRSRQIPATDDINRHRMKAFRRWLLLAGVVWGAAGILLFPEHDRTHQMVLVVILVGLASGAVVSLSADLVCATAFPALVLLPLMAHVFVSGGDFAAPIGMALVLYIGFILVNSRRINQNIRENTMLRFEASLREEAMQASEERYRLLLRHSPVGIFHYDKNLVITYCNDHFAEMLRSPVDQVIGIDMKRINDQAVLPALSKALEGGLGLYEGHYRATFSEAEGWALITCAPYLDDAGNNVGGICIVQDISERRKAEEELQLAALVYRNSGEAMMVTDAENRIIAINPAFTSVTGYEEHEVLGQPPSMLASGRHDPLFYQRMWHALDTLGTWQGEIWNRRKNGDIYAEWLTINTIYHDYGPVYRRVALFSDITEKKKSEELIWQQANYDALTGLPNRRMVHDRLDLEIRKSHREEKPLALMFIDLDRFKEVNDTLGHEIGDELLKDVAQRMAACVRESDTVGRLGGDEFTVIMGELEDVASVERVATQILESLSSPFQLGNDKAYISASIGITLYPDDAMDISTLLKNADQAMYAAKHEGRNRFHYYTPTMQEAADSRMRLTTDLRLALQEQQFRVYYQPIVDLTTGEIRKAEALVRWQHPAMGLVSPASFIPIAEESGLIHDIGDWVFRQAAAQVARLRDTHHSDFQISVNKSPVQFRADPRNRPSWFSYLEEIGLPGKSVVIEITENLLMEAREEISGQLMAFRESGVQVALDDFGTGYSSLSYLKKFHIDYLKIDQSFVRTLEPDSSDLALCEAMVEMAHKLGIKVIAEGVETQLQYDLLRQIGCDYGQGYLWSRPVPAGDFEKLLSSI